MDTRLRVGCRARRAVLLQPDVSAFVEFASGPSRILEKSKLALMSGCCGSFRPRGGRRRVLRGIVRRIIEDACARLAVEEFLIAGTLELLNHVRSDVHAALAASFATDFRTGDSTVA